MTDTLDWALTKYMEQAIHRNHCPDPQKSLKTNFSSWKSFTKETPAHTSKLKRILLRCESNLMRKKSEHKNKNGVIFCFCSEDGRIETVINKIDVFYGNIVVDASQVDTP